MSKPAAQLLVRDANEIVTCAGDWGAGAETALGRIPAGALAVVGGRIAAVGSLDQVLGKIRVSGSTRMVRAKGRVVVPGFVDAHTHLVFAGWRAGEFEQRLAGATYSEIAATGGGIQATVRATRAASEAELRRLAIERARFALGHGTTTIEIKSGYGLDLETETKILRVACSVPNSVPIGVRTTFLGAHSVSPEFRGTPDRYVDFLCRTALPCIRRERLADACDVFCEEGVFSILQGRRILSAARKLGLAVKIHADQLSDLGGARLAAEVGAISADHLVHASPAGLRVMARRGVTGVLLPVSSFFLRMEKKTPVAEMRRAGVIMALGTDYNPGTSTSLSMQTSIRFGCLHYGLSPAEALLAATRGSARALRLETHMGSLAPGMDADFLLLDAPDYRHVAYEFDRNLVTAVFRKGQRVA